jgi:hypothetical protein
MEILGDIVIGYAYRKVASLGPRHGSPAWPRSVPRGPVRRLDAQPCVPPTAIHVSSLRGDVAARKTAQHG